MSRNLCETACYECPAPRVALVERPRPITRDDTGRYFDEYAGMLVAHAECPLCHAKYLAWVDERERIPHHGPYGLHVWNRFAPMYEDDKDYFDLSYRAAFNDEPADEDQPTHDVEIVYVSTPRGNVA